MERERVPDEAQKRGIAGKYIITPSRGFNLYIYIQHYISVLYVAIGRLLHVQPGLLTLPLRWAIGPIWLCVYRISGMEALLSIYWLFVLDLYTGWALWSGC